MTSYMWILLFAALALTKAQDFSLEDAFDDNVPTVKPPAEKPPKKTGDEFDLADGFEDPDEPKPAEPKKPVAPPKTDGGGFSDSDLGDAAGDGYKPDAGGNRPGGRGSDYTDTQGDQPQGAEGGQMAGIISAVGVAILGAASSYFAYQKKKLCFKVQGGTDPESGRNQAGTQSDPQAFSNLLRTS